MKTKLTLRLDRDVIERAKAHAAARGTSVSGLVEDYFRLVASGGTGVARGSASGGAAGGDGAPRDWRDELGPRVRGLVDRTPPRRDVEAEDYRDHLAAKHGVQ